jgi:hypothetical protein
VKGIQLNRHALGAALLCAAVLLAACLASRGPVGATAASGVPRVPAEESMQPPDTRFPADGPSMRRAREIAEGHWAAAPCGGQVAIRWAVQEPGTNATASWRNPRDAWDNAGQNFDCSVEFNPRAEFDWEKLCTVMAHELGHLLGRQHSGGDDLMAPVYSRPLDACAQAQDPAAPPPAAEPVEEPEAEVEAIAAAPQRGTLLERRRAAARRRAARCRAIRRTLQARGRSVKRLRCTVSQAARRASRRS